MQELSHHTDAIPSLAVRRLRGAIRTELEIAGATPDVLQNIDKTLDDLAVEMLVIAAAEVLTPHNQVLEWSVRRACERMDLTSYVAPEELIDRICYDTCTREAIADSYARLRGLVQQSKTPASPAPPVATPMIAVPVLPVPPPPPPPLGRFNLFASRYQRNRALRTLILGMAALSLFVVLLFMAFRSLSGAAFGGQPAKATENLSAPAVQPNPLPHDDNRNRKSR